jgi:hypothetical protein
MTNYNPYVELFANIHKEEFNPYLEEEEDDEED